MGYSPDDETPAQSKARQAGEWMADAIAIAVTGERGGNIRRHLLFLVAGICLVGATYAVAFMAVGLLALILLALGDSTP